MFESDADRLALIRALGGVVFQGPRGAFEGIFENIAAPLGDLPVLSASPQLTVRSIDLARSLIAVGSVVRGPSETYLVREIRDDGSGMASLELEQP